ncbi:hypothetical protein SLEP1_g45658 [Rubroshorea leprosula]|uniref:CrcB-like protein n=1 Tax=Rubroshorea leprosula TaxID=152421 RepID=A0AAV5LJP9_9ROSI|nr:hypothetical protein SLEP1_g45658 [Rubroshorea leprosula]
MHSVAMDPSSNDIEPKGIGSFGMTSSAGSSFRRHSLSISRAHSFQLNDDIESEAVSLAGDAGDLALHSSRHGQSSRISFAIDNALESGAVFPIPEDNMLRSYGFWGREPPTQNAISPVSPMPEEIISPLSTTALNCSEEKDQDEDEALPLFLEYIYCLLHLAIFGILGVLSRYLLQRLFGPSTAGLTSHQSILYLDLPSNLVGSFLMGWWGVVFKEEISRVSNHLAIVLTTGYLGSLTTFSGWNQDMLDLSVHGHWLFSLFGFLFGLFLVDHFIIFGIETAKGFRWLLKRIKRTKERETSSTKMKWRVNRYSRHWPVMVVLLLSLGALWSLSGALLKEEFNSTSAGPQLWLACLVGPPGVWIRWFLARFNGRGLGKAGILRWVPFGTLGANVSAACVTSGLATLKKAVNTRTCDTVVDGIQLGFTGCLSTVSAFIVEFNAMRGSQRPWRAYAYALSTITLSFGFGVLFYDLPVWVKGYK